MPYANIKSYHVIPKVFFWLSRSFPSYLYFLGGEETQLPAVSHVWAQGAWILHRWSWLAPWPQVISQDMPPARLYPPSSPAFHCQWSLVVPKKGTVACWKGCKKWRNSQISTADGSEIQLTTWHGFYTLVFTGSFTSQVVWTQLRKINRYIKWIIKQAYTTWKVDGATPMYWFIIAPY